MGFALFHTNFSPFSVCSFHENMAQCIAELQEQMSLKLFKPLFDCLMEFDQLVISKWTLGVFR